MQITSRENETYKNLLKLTSKKWRRQNGLCIIEGEKIVRDNLSRVECVFARSVGRAAIANGPTQYVLSQQLFDEVSSLENSSGILAIVKIPTSRDITFPFLVLDSVQDPGNMGTLLRTAAAFGFETVFCIDCVDVWSQKVLRASSGVQFNLNIIETSEFVKPQGSVLTGADLNHSAPLGHPRPAEGNFGLVLGSEGRGISANLENQIDKFVTIPMRAGVESLNVAVAGGILMYEFSLEGL